MRKYQKSLYASVLAATLAMSVTAGDIYAKEAPGSQTQAATTVAQETTAAVPSSQAAKTAQEETATAAEKNTQSAQSAGQTTESVTETVTAYDATKVAEGSCGSNAKYVLDTDGVLTITGRGPITTRPWMGYLKKLTKIVIGNGITSIPDGAFYNYGYNVYPEYGAVNVTYIQIPGSVTEIGERAFAAAGAYTNLSLSIANGVKTINKDAFNRSGVTSISIPGSVTSIGESAFYRCSKLTSVTVTKNVKKMGTGIFSDCDKLTSVNLNSGLQLIGSKMFLDCDALQTVDIPSSVTSIGDSAFNSCDEGLSSGCYRPALSCILPFNHSSLF